MTIQEREDALGKFVEREIYVCQSALVEEALKKQIFSIDDLENKYRPFDGRLITPNVCVRCQGEFICLDSETGECESCFEDHQEPQDIYEWWLVSPWFSKRLLMEGEPILDNDYGIWWGRCTTGQATSMDYVIQKIYDDIMQ
ncbi:MAG: hypothetical protein H0W89_01245 [Candidatus Levybacteria bacterium]|nr:hypothetical protein [Candidatus Levybacteria bacterium]